MDQNESSLMKLNKEDLVLLLLDYKGHFKSILDDLKSNFDEIKGISTKLESDLHMSRNVYSNLSDRIFNEKYSRRECLETSGHPNVKEHELKSKLVNILEEMGVPIEF